VNCNMTSRHWLIAPEFLPLNKTGARDRNRRNPPMIPITIDHALSNFIFLFSQIPNQSLKLLEFMPYLLVYQMKPTELLVNS
jgi:hypothetical protein